ncbi:E3 ubiquitin/ISG15 ligase TRIM25 [Bagarius yarrelli]|uniref:E3 ubiquitin/ISG15 ligase TRIM25 n=1 Tax=Bagarius yarrelli TaxID=175774 RepID=A0A556U5U7_BAGYA|nr:E3 ubiquitin/ISG15 ligase TRIM25 [Bagarius yarrelli]
MADAVKSHLEDQFCCSVCLDALKEPVTIPCGHSYCMSCISDFWSGLDQTAVYSCPQCREAFSPKPALKKNTLLTEVMEKMKNASDQGTTSNPTTSACIQLECDFCIGEKNTADKFCLQCLASYCELHLQTHYSSPVFMKHKLVPASSQLQKNICSDHGKLLDVYCCDDQQCICYLCMVESHKGHKSSSVESERIKNQDSLEKKKTECLQMIAEREEGLTELSKASFVQAAEENNERIFTELIDSMKRRCSEVKTLIRAQEKAELSRAEELRQQLDRELKELRARIPEIQQVLTTNDHIDFMQKYTSFCDVSMFEDLPIITCATPDTSDVFSISGVKEHLEDVCQKEVVRMSKQVLYVTVMEPSEPETREDFLQYFCDLHVDPNTINNHLYLSEGDRKLTNSMSAYQYPDHPERFDYFVNLLCKERLYGRCYWEADFSGRNCSIAVTYKSIKRKGDSGECRFGYNANSWKLSFYNKECCFIHNQTEVNIRQFNLKTVGVYVNLRMGTLSFYHVSDKMTLLHKVHATFTKPLYAGFGAGSGSWIRIRQKC